MADSSSTFRGCVESPWIVMHTAPSSRADVCWDRLTIQPSKRAWCFPLESSRTPAPLDWYWAAERGGLPGDLDCLAITSKVLNSSQQTAPSCVAIHTKTLTYFGRCVGVAATSALLQSSK